MDDCKISQKKSVLRFCWEVLLLLIVVWHVEMRVFFISIKLLLQTTEFTKWMQMTCRECSFIHWCKVLKLCELYELLTQSQLHCGLPVRSLVQGHVNTTFYRKKRESFPLDILHKLIKRSELLTFQRHDLDTCVSVYNTTSSSIKSKSALVHKVKVLLECHASILRTLR